MNLTTLDRVRAILEMPEGITQHDEKLQQLIESVSASVEDHLGRLCEKKARTAILDTEESGTGRLIYLKAWPVASIASVYLDYEGAFPTTSLLDTSSYRLLQNGELGLLMLLTSVECWPSCLKVIYTGGLASTPEDFGKDYPAIASAVDQQVVYEFKRSGEIGSDSVSGAGGSVTTGGDQRLIAAVRSTLRPWKKV